MKKPVLVVEDDHEIRQSLVDALQDDGHTVYSARNGQEGLDILRNTKPLPGLIILDVMMPVLNGFQFCTMKNLDPLIADIPIVFLSADHQLAEKAKRAGVNGYIKKPIDLAELFKLTTTYCS
jgi:CheY-like chemotaxis protein